MNYTFKGVHNRHFELFDDKGTALGKLDYTTWFSTKAEIITAGKTFQIAPAGIFHTSVEIKEGDVKIGSLKFNWKGQIIISFENRGTYIFKGVGFLNYHFGLFTEHNHEMVALKQHFKLAEFSFSYTAETDDNYSEANDPTLLLLMVYCANYMHSAAAAAV